MGVLRFKHVFFTSFVGSNAAPQVVFAFLLFPCCLTQEFSAPPFLPNVPYLWAWNAPSEPCSKKFNVPLDLSLFSYVTTPEKDVTEQPITLFYVDRLGLYPHIDSQGVLHHGGIPQLGNLQNHLDKAKSDIAYYMPKDIKGLAVIDWEEWRPLWARNWSLKDIYRNHSIALVQRQNTQLSVKDATNVAKQYFEGRGRQYMVETLKLGKSLRPNSLWGYYLFPDCYNHHYRKPDYNGHCFDVEKKRNDELNWLWNESTALFPSIYLNTYLQSSKLAALFVRNRVHEGLRVAKAPNAESPLPVFIYSRPVFTDAFWTFLNEVDLVNTLGESIALGAAGIIMWGGLNLTQNEDACSELQDHLKTTLNPYIINLTLAAKMCSQVFCQEQGLCVRRNWDSFDYLHLNAKNLAIEMRNDGTFTIRGKPTVEDLREFSQKFRCRCYANVSCERNVSFSDIGTIHVCAGKDVCVKATIKSENEIFHSSTTLVYFLLLFSIVLENEFIGIQTNF